MMKILALLAVLIPLGASATDLGKGRPYDYLHVHVAPDPVNVRNGNFYLPLPDYYQACFGFPLEVYRSYNSFSSRNGPFGRGWTFNYDIQIVVGEKGVLQIIEPDGFVNEYVSSEFAQQSEDVVIQKIIDAKKKEDIAYMKNKEGKGAAYYKDIEDKLRKDSAYYERQRDRYVTDTKQPTDSGKFVSYSRGTTYLTKTANGYTRSTEVGQTEEYNLDGGIVKISDRVGNELSFSYDAKSKLSKIADGCGNHLLLSYGPNAKISKIRDSFSREMTYQYDKDSQLISSKGIDKQEILYSYDSFKRMVAILFKDDGSKTTIQYDPKTSRVVAQDGPGKKKTTYTYSKNGSALQTRIQDNQGENTLYEYNDRENKVSQTDAKGVKTTTVLSECCGKPVLIETSQGVKDTFEYDEKGNLISKTDTKGAKTFFEYDPRFSQVSEIRDDQGEILRYRYDQNGNISFAKKIFPDKTSVFVKLTHESHGKISGIQDDQDQEIKFSYSRLGKPTSIELWKAKKKIAEIRAQYKEDGTMENRQYLPNNPETVDKIMRVLKGYVLILKPAGIDFEI